MKTLTCMIVDDEPLAVKMLEFFFCPKLFKAYPRVDSNSCGAVAEDSAKTAC